MTDATYNQPSWIYNQPVAQYLGVVTDAKYNQPGWIYNQPWVDYVGTATDVATVQASSLFEEAFGDALLSFDNRIDVAAWTVQTAAGTPSLAHNRRLLEPEGVAAPAIGDIAVTHWLQWIDSAGQGPGPEDPPTPTATESPRTLDVPWTIMGSFGIALIGFDRQVDAPGFDAALFGLLQVLDNSQTVGCGGIAPADPPQPLIYLPVRTVSATGFRAQNNDERYGNALVNNEDQWITALDAWERERVSIVPRPTVGLFDRPLRPDWYGAGEVSTRVTVTHLNTPLKPSGLDSEGHGVTFISHEHRTLDVAGAVLGFFGVNAAYNDASVIAPFGLTAAAVGAHATRNDLRFISQNNTGNDPHTTYGNAFVADALRAVRAVQWTTQTRVGDGSRVSLWERTIQPDGVDAFGRGGHYFERRQNIIATIPVMPPGIPAPTARRISIDPTSFQAFESGHARLLLDPQPVTMLGTDFGAVGNLHQVYRRNRTVWPSGNIDAPAVPLQHRVQNELPDPPGERTLLVSGLEYPAAAVSSPLVQSSRLFVSGVHSSQVGQPAVTGTGLFPPGIPQPGYATGGNVGVPTTSGDRWLSPTALMPPDISNAHRLSPHYIFGPVGLGQGHIIDYYVHGPNNLQRPVFGAVDVQHQHRTLHVSAPLAPVEEAVHHVSSFLRTLQVPGLRSWRVGIPIVPSGVPVRPIAIDALPPGQATVGHVVDGAQTITFVSGLTTAIGALAVENMHRDTQPTGFDATSFGEAWVDRAVRTYTADGFNAALYGTADVSHRIRTLPLDGWDSAQVTHAPGETRYRMRVTRGTAPATPAVVCAGVDTGAIGGATISHFEQMIGCGGIMAPQTPIPAPVLSPSNVVLPHGSGASLDYLSMGAPAMWRPGDPLVPFAVDMALFGTPTTVPVASPASIDAAAVGTASMVLPLDPLGELYVLFGSHLLAHGNDSHVCGQLLRGIRAGAYAFDAIGTAGVAHD